MANANENVWVKILRLHEDYAFGKMFRVVRAELQHRRFDGTLSAPLTRVSFERGDSVGVLLYDRDENTVILVRQFRYPVYSSLGAAARDGDGARRAWMLEIVAGVRDAGGSARDVAHKELLEEAGYRIKGLLEPMMSFYASPGGSSERIMLFCAEVDRASRVGAGGGAAEEGEDIEVVAVPLEEAMKMIASGEICDAKTIIALQGFTAARGLGSNLGL